MDSQTSVSAARISFRHWRGLIGLLVALVAVSPAWALNLYQGTVMVADQSEEALKPGIREALDVVVVKLSGRQDVLNQAPLRETLDGATSLVQQFQYVSLPDDQTALQVQFQKQALDALLRRHGVPVWGRSRPELVTWLAVDDGTDRLIAQPETHPSARILEEVAANRGIPLLMPLLDMEDLRLVGFNDVWGGFGDRLSRASQRYAGDHILSVRLLRLNGDGWHARWSLQHGRETQRWQSRGDALRQVLASGFAQVADHLAIQYAPQTVGMEQSLGLKVSGIQSAEHFARVANYLASLDRVERVNWTRYSAGSAEFALVFSGELSDFEQVLSLNRLLIPDPSAVPLAIGGGPEEAALSQPLLFYRLKQ